jgi:hypothetical protein
MVSRKCGVFLLGLFFIMHSILILVITIRTFAVDGKDMMLHGILRITVLSGSFIRRNLF